MPAGCTSVRCDPIGGSLSDAASIHLWRAQLELGPIATPYKNTGATSATRAAARVQAPATLIDETQGWAAFRIRYGYPSTALPAYPYLLYWHDVGSSGIDCYLDSASKKFRARRFAGGAIDVVESAAQTFAKDDGCLVIAAWTATEIKISVNGGAFVSAASTNIPTLAAAFFDIASWAGSYQLDGDVLWSAFGKGTLTDADAADLHALGDADPAGDLPLAAGLSALWPADDAEYLVHDEAPAQTGDYHIEQIRHAIGGTPRHVCSLLVSRVIAKALQFDVSEFDGTDVFVY